MNFKRNKGGWFVQLSPTSSIRVFKNDNNEFPWEYSVYDHDNGLATVVKSEKGFSNRIHASAHASENNSVVVVED